MRIIAIINQKGGVGKTTTVANLGAALARAGKRVVVFDLDPQANLSLYLGSEVGRGEASVYGVLTDGLPVASCLRETRTPGLRLVASHLDLSGAELELASTLGRETLLRDALQQWVSTAWSEEQQPPADYVLLDCPPSLGLLSVNALVAADEVMIAVQTEFFALQGLSKLVEIVQLLRRRMNPGLTLTGIIPCLYDSRLKLAREVLVELRKHFPGKVFASSIRTNVRLAESPSFGQTIFEYAPESNGAQDYARLAAEVLAVDGVPATPVAASVAAGQDDQAIELNRAAEALKDLEARGPEALAKPNEELPQNDSPSGSGDHAPQAPEDDVIDSAEEGAPSPSKEALQDDSVGDPEDRDLAGAADEQPDSAEAPSEPDPAKPRSSQPPSMAPPSGQREAGTEAESPQGSEPLAPRLEAPQRSEVDAELAAYELPRANGHLDRKRNLEDDHIAVNIRSSADPNTRPSGASGETPPLANSQASGDHPKEPQKNTLYSDLGGNGDAHPAAESPESPTQLLVEPTPEPATASPGELGAEPAAADKTPAEALEAPEAEATGVESESQPTEETQPEPTQPAPTPVYGFGRYIGEDRWTQRPRS